MDSRCEGVIDILLGQVPLQERRSEPDCPEAVCLEKFHHPELAQLKNGKEGDYDIFPGQGKRKEPFEGDRFLPPEQVQNLVDTVRNGHSFGTDLMEGRFRYFRQKTPERLDQLEQLHFGRRFLRL